MNQRLQRLEAVIFGHWDGWVPRPERNARIRDQGCWDLARAYVKLPKEFDIHIDLFQRRPLRLTMGCVRCNARRERVAHVLVC